MELIKDETHILDDKTKRSYIMSWLCENKESFLKTGSRVIGGETKKSDYDYVVPIIDKYKDSHIKELMEYFSSVNFKKKMKEYSDMETFSLKIKSKGQILNFLFCFKNIYKRWVETTRMFKEFKEKLPELSYKLMKEKQNRCDIFSLVFNEREKS